MAFIRGSNPVWFMVDLASEHFDDTFYMWVLENQIPYIPAQVYHDVDGNIPWTSPIQFLANGTLPIDIFFDDEVVYRLEFRQNDGTAPPSQADALIYLVENYSPNGTGGNPIVDSDSVTENQITNGQFADINFSSPYTFAGTNPPPIDIGAGWFLELTGTGTLQLDRIPLDSSIPTPTNAPYALRIQLGGGWTGSPKLRQRLQQNGVLWAEQYVSTSFTARIGGASQNISARLVASDGLGLAILENAALTNAFVEYTGISLLPASANLDVPPDAYIEYQILLPTVCDVYLTSIQLAAAAEPITLAYQQDTIDRQLDHTFHYYNPKLQYKPIPSYLVGWDFPLNPAQFGEAIGPIATGANGSFYAWDQTIIFQSVDNGITVGRSASGGIEITAAIAGNAAIIQYLDQAQAREILSGNCSVAIKASSSFVVLPITISLYATNDANLPDINSPTFDSLVATLDANGVVTAFNGAWTALAPNNPGTVDTVVTDLGIEETFTGWKDNLTTPRVADATFFAIVIGISNMIAADTVTFDYISLNAGDIATRPAPQSFDEVLQQCQYFYEKSYANETAVGATTLTNALAVMQQTSIPTPANTSMLASGFGFQYGTIKRAAAPTVELYSPVTGTAGNVRSYMVGAVNADIEVDVATFWVPTVGSKAASYSAGSTALINTVGAVGATQPGQGSIAYHYTVDARFGVVN